MAEISLLEALGSPSLELLPPAVCSANGLPAATVSATTYGLPAAKPSVALPPPSGRRQGPRADPVASGPNSPRFPSPP